MYIYTIESFPSSAKLNWLKDCLDFVEYMTCSIVKWSPECDAYYIAVDEALEITELYNDFGLVARLTLDEDNNIHPD